MSVVKSVEAAVRGVAAAQRDYQASIRSIDDAQDGYQAALRSMRDPALHKALTEQLHGHQGRLVSLTEHLEQRQAVVPGHIGGERAVMLRSALGVAAQLGNEMVLAVLRQFEAQGLDVYRAEVFAGEFLIAMRGQGWRSTAARPAQPWQQPNREAPEPEVAHRGRAVLDRVLAGEEAP